MGIGTQVRLYVSAKSRSCELTLINLGKRVRELLRLTLLSSVFTVIGDHDNMMKVWPPDRDCIRGMQEGYLRLASLKSVRARLGEGLKVDLPVSAWGESRPRRQGL